MAKPPSGYPSENGAAAPCGWTWKTNVKITGEIPGFDYGSSENITLGPIVYPGNVPTHWGWRTDKESQFIDKVQQTILQTQADVNSLLREDPDPTNGFRPGDMLTGKQANSLGWLLAHAEAQLEGAQEIYDSWDHRYGGPWPLSKPDDVASFFGPCVLKPRGEWIEGERGDKILCPLDTESVKREMDRKKIRARLEDAVHHVRCAQWGLWRLVLYGRARRKWLSLHPTGDLVSTPVGPLTGVGQSGPSGFASPQTHPLTPGGYTSGPQEPPPPSGPGGYQSGGSGPPPEEPSDFHLPDPGDLPPPDTIPEDEGPVSSPLDRSSGGETPAESHKGLKAAALLGVGALAYTVLKR